MKAVVLFEFPPDASADREDLLASPCDPVEEGPHGPRREAVASKGERVSRKARHREVVRDDCRNVESAEGQGPSGEAVAQNEIKGPGAMFPEEAPEQGEGPGGLFEADPVQVPQVVRAQARESEHLEVPKGSPHVVVENLHPPARPRGGGSVEREEGRAHVVNRRTVQFLGFYIWPEEAVDSVLAMVHDPLPSLLRPPRDPGVIDASRSSDSPI